jgi:hypothetical protein
MPEWIIEGVLKDTGEDVVRIVNFPSSADARSWADEQGVSVVSIELYTNEIPKVLQRSKTAHRLSPSPHSVKILFWIRALVIVVIVVVVLFLVGFFKIRLFSQGHPDHDPETSSHAQWRE